MAVNWLWKDKLGEIIYKREKDTFKLQMFGGNMMCCFIYRCKNENNEKMYNFFLWYNDIEHAKRLHKDTRLEDFILGDNIKVVKVRININSGNKYSDKEMLQLAKLYADMGYKVELYKHKNF